MSQSQANSSGTVEAAPISPARIWAPVWRRRGWWNGWFLPAVLVGLALVFIGGGYEVTVHFNGWRGQTVWSPATSLDSWIPMVPWSVLPYTSVYVYFVLTVVVPSRRDEGLLQMVLVYQALFLIAAISFACFLLLPCEVVSLRQLPEPIRTHQGWPGCIYAFVHSLDTPYNAWPSLHVSLSLLVATYLSWRVGRRRPFRVVVLWVGWCLLAVSTLTTKQHMVFDVATGIGIAVIVWFASLRPALVRSSRQATLAAVPPQAGEFCKLTRPSLNAETRS